MSCARCRMLVAHLVASCDGVAADSLDWFKISEATWDGTEWPSAKINRDAGEFSPETRVLASSDHPQDWSFSIPSDIAPGPYLVRTEIIAMHFEWVSPASFALALRR